jgi:hypothetical protein
MRKQSFAVQLVWAVAASLSMMTAQAHAINRYTSTSMTCSEVAATISREGAAIMRWTGARTGNLVYDRYVRNRQFCQPNQTTQRKYIPTADVPGCPVYRCKEIEFYDLR